MQVLFGQPTHMNDVTILAMVDWEFEDFRRSRARGTTIGSADGRCSTVRNRFWLWCRRWWLLHLDSQADCRRVAEELLDTLTSLLGLIALLLSEQLLEVYEEEEDDAEGETLWDVSLLRECEELRIEEQIGRGFVGFFDEVEEELDFLTVALWQHLPDFLCIFVGLVYEGMNGIYLSCAKPKCLLLIQKASNAEHHQPKWNFAPPHFVYSAESIQHRNFVQTTSKLSSICTPTS